MLPMLELVPIIVYQKGFFAYGCMAATLHTLLAAALVSLVTV